MAKKNKISDLRDHLFETLEALKDPDNPMDIDRALAVSQVAQTLINSAKVEVDLVKACSASKPGSDFFAIPQEDSRALPVIPAQNRFLNAVNEEDVYRKRA